MKFILKYILPVLFLHCSLISQEKINYQRDFPDPKFEYLTINDGLPNNTVTCILQDRYGYLWLGTYFGLAKYDGFSITSYASDPFDSLSISHRWIKTIYEDQQGILWIGTANGLNSFNRKNETFEHFLESQHIIGIYEDSSGNFWIAGKQKIFLFDRIANLFQQFDFEDSNINIMLGDSGSDKLYLGTNNGLFSFDLTRRTFHKSFSDEHTGSVFSLYKAKNGMILIGSDKGFADFNPANEQLRFNKNISSPIKVIMEDDEGFIWCYAGSQAWATQEKELIVFNPNTAEYKRMNSEIVMNMYKDQSGVIWIGTGWAGLKKWDRKRWKFNSYRHDPGNANSLISDYVWAVYPDTGNIIWIGTNKGLDRFDRMKGEFKHYPIDKNEITYIHNNNDDYLWLGTLKSGLVKFDPKNETYHYYSHNPQDINSISGNHIFTIFTDHLGDMWIGTRYNGVNRFNRETNKITRYKHDPDDSTSISGDEIYSIYEDKKVSYGLVMQAGA